MTENKPAEQSKPAGNPGTAPSSSQGSSSSSSSSSAPKKAQKEEVTQLGSSLKLAPESIVTDKGQITSAATLQEDRRPGVQYPASSNQLPVDFEAQDQETPQQRADREVAESIAKHNEGQSDLLAAAATSGDATVHQLLAHRGVAEQNGDQAALEAVDEKLAEVLGA